MQIDRQLQQFARFHNGLVTRAAWKAGGRSTRSFDRTIQRGLLVWVAPNVAALAGQEIGQLQRIHAEVLASPGSVLASHRSAAFVWGAPVTGDDPVDLTTRSGSTRRRSPLVVLHRPRDHKDLRLVTRRHVPVTSPGRTLVDLGAVEPEAVVAALESFLVSGFVTVPAVQRSLDRHRRRGRHGVGALTQALDALVLGSAAPDSALESAMGELFTQAELTGWTFHARIAGYEVDFAFLRERVVIEVDGFAFHAGREAFERDRERDAALVALGWTVLRFTWRQVTDAPAIVVQRLRAVLASRAA